MRFVFLFLSFAAFVGCGGKVMSERLQPEPGDSAGGTGGYGGTTGGYGGGYGGTGGFGGTTSDSGPASGGGAQDAEVPDQLVPPPECVGAQPTLMVELPEGFAIDATEVTRCQYAIWLASNPSTANQIAQCKWNTNFTPSCEWPPGDQGNHPVGCVDWCDAFAYCSAVGKRLCGKIGGGSADYDNYDDPTSSQWMAACSSGGLHAYPYGNTFNPLACNGGPGSNAGQYFVTVPVGSLSECQPSSSGYAGIFDLSGNVWEWEDACQPDGDKYDFCRLRGGSCHVYADALTCTADGYKPRDTVLHSYGFRCCSDM